MGKEGGEAVNYIQISCPGCGAGIYGEPGFSDCGCGALPCRCERWAPGCWYVDGEEYACESCGAVSVCKSDGEETTLSLKEAQP